MVMPPKKPAPTDGKTAKSSAKNGRAGAKKPPRQPPLFDLVEEDPAIVLRRSLGDLSEGVLVAGLDEVGRGPLAGPVVAAACVLPEELPDPLRALNDSKKLTEEARELLYPLILEHALGWGVSVVEHHRIDEINILRASLEAMCLALEACERHLGRHVAGAVLDGNQKAPLPARIVQRTVIGGDALSRPIMAASILAKVTRDRRMLEEHARHPGYGFDAHKGYGTPQHLDALKKLGPSPIHRRTFAPVLQRVQPQRPEPARERERA